jgi:hypothetical protein
VVRKSVAACQPRRRLALRNAGVAVALTLCERTANNRRLAPKRISAGQPCCQLRRKSGQRADHLGSSALCHKRTYAVQQIALYSITWSARNWRSQVVV